MLHADYVAKPIFDDALLAIVDSHARRPNPLNSTDNEILSQANPHVSRALKAIEQRYREPDLSVGSVAKSIDVSIEHLCRLMKHHTGNSFQKILIRTRVSEARKLLETTTLSVKEIAARVGFRDASHCDHNFKAVCGLSPREHRKTASQQHRSEQ